MCDYFPNTRKYLQLFEISVCKYFDSSHHNPLIYSFSRLQVFLRCTHAGCPLALGLAAPHRWLNGDRTVEYIDAVPDQVLDALGEDLTPME